jgi:hypothetical protein
MSISKILGCLVVTCVLLPTSAFATNSVLSGIFDGSESKTAPLPGTCGGTDPLGFQQAGSFTVSASGTYTVTEAYNVIGVDISALIYSGSFNVNNPLANLVTPIGVDSAELVSLNSGTTYILVVQQWCTNPARSWVNRQGAWAIALSGPGSVASSLKVAVPSMTQGTFGAGDPTANTSCGNSQYKETGPIQVSSSGSYYYADVSINYAVDMCLQIFTAPFNPSDPTANRVANEKDDFGNVELQAGKDYYFVTQPLDESAEGEFFYLFVPQAPFYITYAMAGSWFYPATAGQGFVIDVFDSANLMFLAWFTYDLERPPSGVTAMIGDPGHRWMTAIGPTEGNTANLNITWSSGMIFDSEMPAAQNQSDGTMTVEFYDCYTGLIKYDLGVGGPVGDVPIERIVNDAVPFCEAMTEGPGKPGPL